MKPILFGILFYVSVGVLLWGVPNVHFGETTQDAVKTVYYQSYTTGVKGDFRFVNPLYSFVSESQYYKVIFDSLQPIKAYFIANQHILERWKFDQGRCTERVIAREDGPILVYRYDPAGLRVGCTAYSINRDKEVYQYTYTYNANQDMISETQTDAKGKMLAMITLGYDADHQLTETTMINGKGVLIERWVYEYQKGKKTRAEKYNPKSMVDFYVEYGYDQIGKPLNEITYKSKEEILSWVVYEYNESLNLVEKYWKDSAHEIKLKRMVYEYESQDSSKPSVIKEYDKWEERPHRTISIKYHSNGDVMETSFFDVHHEPMEDEHGVFTYSFSMDADGEISIQRYNKQDELILE